MRGLAGKAGRGKVWLVKVRLGMAGLFRLGMDGMDGQGMAGKVGQGMVRLGTVWCGAVR